MTEPDPFMTAMAERGSDLFGAHMPAIAEQMRGLPGAHPGRVALWGGYLAGVYGAMCNDLGAGGARGVMASLIEMKLPEQIERHRP